MSSEASSNAATPTTAATEATTAPTPAIVESRTDLTSLLTSVPHDPWFRVRVVAMSVAACVYLWWLRAEGLITDRITASVAVGVFLVCAFVGKPWRRWLQVAVGAVLYAGMWFVYENTRGAADHLGMPYQMAAARNTDRVLFLGVQPTEWLQQHWYTPGEVRLHDQILSLVYYSHFVVPVVAVAAVWASGHVRWVRYMRRFATVLFVACATFVLLPTVPPWMASDERFGWGVGEPLVRHVRAGILDLGFTGFAHDWGVALDWSNVVAAMPSLHAAFSLFVVVYVRPMLRRRWLRIAVFAYPLAMAVALVYFAEHWVIDVLVGWALTGASFAVWARLEREARTDRVVLAARAGAGHVDDIPQPSATRDPAVVVLTAPLLAAVVDDTDADHERAIATYAALLARYHADEIRLVARHDHLEAFDRAARRTVLAPVAAVHVAGQYRRQAARLAIPGCSADDVVTLVTARRSRAVAVAELGETATTVRP
jgi:hypothetical protein